MKTYISKSKKVNLRENNMKTIQSLMTCNALAAAAIFNVVKTEKLLTSVSG